MPPSRFPPPTYPPGYTPSSRTRVVGSYESHYAKRNLSINIPFIKILATGFNPMDVQRDIVKEMERAFKESAHFKRLAAYIRYLPEDHIGESQGSIPPLRCKDPTPKGIADCLAEWVGERLVSTVGDYFLTQAEEKYHIQEAMADYHALYPPYNPLPRLTPEQIDALNSRPLPKFEDMLEDIYRGMEANGYDVRNAWASRLLEATMLPSKPLPTASEPGRDAPMDAVLLSADVPPEMIRMAAVVEAAANGPETSQPESVQQPVTEETKEEHDGFWVQAKNTVLEAKQTFVDALTALYTIVVSGLRIVLDFQKGFGKQFAKRLWELGKAVLELIVCIPELLKALGTLCLGLLGALTGGKFFKEELQYLVDVLKQIAQSLKGIPGFIQGRIDALAAAETPEEFGKALADITFDILELVLLLRMLIRAVTMVAKLIQKAFKALKNRLKKRPSARPVIEDMDKVLDHLEKARKATDKMAQEMAAKRAKQAAESAVKADAVQQSAEAAKRLQIIQEAREIWKDDFDNWLRRFERLEKNPVNSSHKSLISEDAIKHILLGDEPGSGGHLYPSAKGKTPWPKDWSPEKIISTVVDVATDPQTEWYQQTGRIGSILTKNKGAVVQVGLGYRETYPIIVVMQPFERGKGIITSFISGENKLYTTILKILEQKYP